MPTALSSDLAFRPAVAEDKPFVWNLNQIGYRPVITAQFGAWDDADQLARFDIKWAAHSYCIVMAGSTAIGAFSITDACDHVYLNEILLLPEHQNRGFGTQVIQSVVDHARARGVRTELRVLLLNRARSLYERHGFVVSEQTPTHFLLRLDSRAG